MEKIKFGKTGFLVTRVAMGGIPIMRLERKDAARVVRKVIDWGVNFIDTANGYGDSEEKIGEAIQGMNRESLVIASKSGVKDKKTFLEHVDLSLRRLRVDYIDIYHLHGVNSEEKMSEVMGSGGAYEGLEEAVKLGKVRHYAFSSHQAETAKKLMLTQRFEVAQIPFNFVNTEPEEELIPLARRLNMGFIAMKPLAGGALENAVLAFRYLSQFPSVVPDPGIERVEEMEEILTVMKNVRPLTLEEKDAIERTRKELGKVFCRRCGYCQPCPQEIPIALVLSIESAVKRAPLKDVIRWGFGKAMEKARSCTECEECLERCPYDLPVPSLIKEKLAFWDEIL